MRINLSENQKIFGGLLAFVAAIMALTFFVAVPWAEAQDAQNSRQLTRIHQLGFTGVKDSDLATKPFSGSAYLFYYDVGTCTLPIYVQGNGSHSQTYIDLDSIPGATVDVTFSSLRKLSQTHDCFIR